MKRIFLVALGVGGALVVYFLVVFHTLDVSYFQPEAQRRARLAEERKNERRRQKTRKPAETAAEAKAPRLKPFPVPSPASSALAGAQLVPFRRFPETKVPQTAERKPFRVTLRPMFAGEALCARAVGSMSVSLQNWQDGIVHRQTVAFNTETITVDDLAPGTFTCTLLLDADPTNPPGYPGDFQNWSRTFHRSADDDSVVPVPTVQVIQVTQPADNFRELPAGTAATDSIMVAWEGIPEADRYEVIFGRSPHRYPRTSFPTIDTSITISELVPDRYLAWVEAFRGKEKIGEAVFHLVLEITAQGGKHVKRLKGPLPVAFFSSSAHTHDGVGEFFYAGKPFFFSPDIKTQVTVRQGPDKTLIHPAVEMSSGSVRIKDLNPGTYDVRVILDHNSANPLGFPGDLLGNGRIAVGSQTTRFGVSLYRMMCLIHPEDTGTLQVAERIQRGGIPLVKTPVLVEWQSLGPGLKYTFSVFPGNIDGTTTGTAVLLSLAPNVTHYLRVSAFSPIGYKIGELTLLSPDYPTNYPFHVEALPEDPFQEPGGR